MLNFKLMSVLAFLFVSAVAQAAPKALDLPTLDHPACAGAKLAAALVPVPIVRSCDKDQDGRNDCTGKNPYQCSLACLGLTGIDLDANMRMPVDQGDGTCARSNLADALIWKGEVAPGNDRPGESYVDPRKPLPSGVLLFGAYHTRSFYVNTKIDYCDSALGDLRRCAQERDELQTKLAALQTGTPTGTVATDTVSQGEYELMVAAYQQIDARIEAAKQCRLQGRQYVFGGHHGDDRCEPIQSAGLVQSQWWPVGVATVFALLFGAMLWKWWQDRDAIKLAKDNLRVFRLSMKELLARSDALLNRLKEIAQALGVSVEANLAEIARKLKAAHDGQAVEMRRTRTTLQFGSSPELGASLEYGARQIVDDLAQARQECRDQAARISELTGQGNAERAALVATQAGELEAERSRSKELTAQLRGKNAEVEAFRAQLEALQAQSDPVTPSFPRAPTPLPPVDLTDALRQSEDEACRLRGEVQHLQQIVAELKAQFATRGEVADIDARVERLEMLEARGRGLKNYLPVLRSVNKRLKRSESAGAQVEREGIRGLIQDIESFPTAALAA